MEIDIRKKVVDKVTEIRFEDAHPRMVRILQMYLYFMMRTAMCGFRSLQMITRHLVSRIRRQLTI